MSEANVVQLAPNRTKIVAKIGPGSRTPQVLRKLIEVGVDVFRLNFSHGTHDEHSAVLADIRTLSREFGQHVAIWGEDRSGTCALAANGLTAHFAFDAYVDDGGAALLDYSDHSVRIGIQ